MFGLSQRPSLLDDDLTGWLSPSFNRRSALPARSGVIIVAQPSRFNQTRSFPYLLDAFARRRWLLPLPMSQAKLDDLWQAILDR
jgi:hypothetical protein